MLDDLTTLVTEIGDKLDVVMVPKVQGAEDIHYVDRLLAQLEAQAGLDRPILVHAILETARGVANVEEICGASPRMQGLSPRPGRPRRRPPDEDDPGRRRPPGLPGPPGPATRRRRANLEAARATYQQDLWHYTIARMVDACAMHGIYPYYGPFGDIADVVACEDQFRNAFLLGCVGAWSLHPKQIEIANKVFSPSVEDVAHARRVVAAMGDGTGAVMLDGKMEDDASLKQCLVMVELAEQLAERRPRARRSCTTRSSVVERVTRRSGRAGRCSTCRRPTQRALEKAKTIPCDALILDLEDAVAPDAKPAAREAACAAAASGEYGRRELTIRVNGVGTEWHDDDLRGRLRGRAGRDRRTQGQQRRRGPPRSSTRWSGTTPPTHTRLWAMVETPVAILRRRGDRRARRERLTVPRDGHQRPGQGAVRRARARPRSRC